MKDAILRKTRESAEVKEAFFRAEAARIEALARAMAGAFARGGRLLVMGNGGSATDAQHVALEFFHPIVEKRKALPAIALTVDPALMTAIANDRDFTRVFADQLRVHARPATWRWRSARAGSPRTSSRRSRWRGSWTDDHRVHRQGRRAAARPRRPRLRGALIQHSPRSRRPT